MSGAERPSVVERVRLECPHPDCQGMIGVAPNLPPGVYRCICHQIEVRLSWTDGAATLERVR